MELTRSEENVQGSPAPCCVFSRLRVASVIIGAVNSVVYLSLFSWWAFSSSLGVPCPMNFIKSCAKNSLHQVSYSQWQLQPNDPGPTAAGLAGHLCGHPGLHCLLCPGNDDKYISLQIHSFAQMLVNTLLVVGSLNHISSHLFPWLCVTATCVILAIVSLDESIKFCKIFGDGQASKVLQV